MTDAPSRTNPWTTFANLTWSRLALLVLGMAIHDTLMFANRALDWGFADMAFWIVGVPVNTAAVLLIVHALVPGDSRKDGASQLKSQPPQDGGGVG